MTIHEFREQPETVQQILFKLIPFTWFVAGISVGICFAVSVHYLL